MIRELLTAMDIAIPDSVTVSIGDETTGAPKVIDLVSWDDKFYDKNKIDSAIALINSAKILEKVLTT